MRLLICVALMGALAFSAFAAEGDHLAAVFPGTGFLLSWASDFKEPSGLTYHPGRGTLFVVSDEGYVGELDTDGELLRQKEVPGDLEGITCDPATGLLYVAIEGAETILEVDPDQLKTLRRFPLDRTLGGKTVMAEGGQGIESIAFVPDADHPEGGTFLVANQAWDLGTEGDVSAVFEVALPLKSGPAKGEIPAKASRQMSFGISDLSGLAFDAESKRLYIASDANNLLLEATLEGEVLRHWACPGMNQEGIASGPEPWVYFAQDSGGIVRYEWRRDQ